VTAIICSMANTGITGIVMVGGQSTRMKRDKGLIYYHGIPQREYTYHLLEELCSEVYFSCRRDQLREFVPKQHVIPDSFVDKGPMGALLSVFTFQPNTAKLVVATDLPYLDKPTLQCLVNNRNPAKIATAFRNPSDNKPDPLLTIWEPHSYPLVKKAFAEGLLSLRYLLIHSDAELLNPTDKRAIQSVDSPEEFKKALRHLKK